MKIHDKNLTYTKFCEKKATKLKIEQICEKFEKLKIFKNSKSRKNQKIHKNLWKSVTPIKSLIDLIIGLLPTKPPPHKLLEHLQTTYDHLTPRVRSGVP